MENNIYIAGVGGQGVVSLGQILATYGLEKGERVKFYKQVGMAQRGGPVHCEVRIGEVFGSRIPPLSADIIVVMELAEGLKTLEFVKPGGIAILNRRKIYPLNLMAYPERYPQEREIIHLFEEVRAKIIWIEAGKVAIEIGLPLAENIILLGAIANFLSLDKDVLLSILEKNVPGKLEKNVKALERGYQIVEGIKQDER